MYRRVNLEYARDLTKQNAVKSKKKVEKFKVVESSSED